MSYVLDMGTPNQVGNTPRRGKLRSTDNLAAITSAGYLTLQAIQPQTLYQTDIIDCTYSYDAATGTGTNIQLGVSFSGGIVTLFVDSGDIVLPTIANNLAVFLDTQGTLGVTSNTTAIHLGDIEAGSTSLGGNFKSYPGSQASYFVFRAQTQGGPYGSFLQNASFGQSTNITIADPGNAFGYIQTTTQNPDPCANLISFDVTVGQAALAAGGNVPLIVSSGSKRYKLRMMNLNSGGTNFSGGGGDRNISITDGTTVYSVIPAATAQSLTNSNWGTTGLPYPVSAAANTSTAAGANLRAIYSGGTADYTAGSLVISAIYQRVA